MEELSKHPIRLHFGGLGIDGHDQPELQPGLVIRAGRPTRMEKGEDDTVAFPGNGTDPGQLTLPALEPLRLLSETLFQKSSDGAGRPFPAVVSDCALNLGFVLPCVESIRGKIQIVVRFPPTVPYDGRTLTHDRHIDGAATSLCAFGFSEPNLVGLMRWHQRAEGQKEVPRVFRRALFEGRSQDVLAVDDRSDLDCASPLSRLGCDDSESEVIHVGRHAMMLPRATVACHIPSRWLGSGARSGDI
ncbi:hypothetical protein [Streptomyces sp. NBC_00658]|uniref:hypothetical protein n=1 Tax=Streptomyces sp. NBC_00658 TaxID=2975800 RepID=UPI003247366D